MKHASLFAMAIVAAGAAGVAHAELRAGVGTASINPIQSVRGRGYMMCLPVKLQ